MTSTTTPRFLLDTNVLVYPFDRSEPAEQVQALSVLQSARACRRAVVSSQVLTEFFTVVTRKIATPLTRQEARECVHAYVASWPVLPVTAAVVLEATRGACERSLNLWDALLWATPKLNQVPVIPSEDFASGSTVDGVTFVNPFATEFAAERWFS